MKFIHSGILNVSQEKQAPQPRRNTKRRGLAELFV